MAVGWANDDSVSQQIQHTIDDEISHADGHQQHHGNKFKTQ